MSAQPNWRERTSLTLSSSTSIRPTASPSSTAEKRVPQAPTERSTERPSSGGALVAGRRSISTVSTISVRLCPSWTKPERR